jgi:hypothetical protein
MKARRKQEHDSKTTPSATSLRASVSFPPELYRILEEIAKQKKVSLAWVVRDAAERYVADQTAETTRLNTAG